MSSKEEKNYSPPIYVSASGFPPVVALSAVIFLEIHIKMTALERNKRIEAMITLSNTILGDLKK